MTRKVQVLRANDLLSRSKDELELLVSNTDWREVVSVGVPIFADGSIRVSVLGIAYPLAIPTNAEVQVR